MVVWLGGVMPVLPQCVLRHILSLVCPCPCPCPDEGADSAAQWGVTAPHTHTQGRVTFPSRGPVRLRLRRRPNTLHQVCLPSYGPPPPHSTEADTHRIKVQGNHHTGIISCFPSSCWGRRETAADDDAATQEYYFRFPSFAGAGGKLQLMMMQQHMNIIFAFLLLLGLCTRLQEGGQGWTQVSVCS